MIPVKPVIGRDGREWCPFSVWFTTPEGDTFEVTLHAHDFDHADVQLQRLKDTGVVKFKDTHYEDTSSARTLQ